MRGNSVRKKTRNLVFRVTEEELKEIHQKAEDAGISITQYVIKSLNLNATSSFYRKPDFGGGSKKEATDD